MVLLMFIDGENLINTNVFNDYDRFYSGTADTSLKWDCPIQLISFDIRYQNSY